MRHALRLFAKSPGFTGVAVLTLALGIGANTAVFSVVDALLLRPLPVRQAERLMVMTSSSQARGLTGVPMSLTIFQQIERDAGSFSGVAAIAQDGFTHTGQGEPEQLGAARVSANFFEVLGARPAMGRTFAPAEGESGGPLVAVLSEGLWRKSFATDPAIIGKPIQLGGAVYTVIGVLPAGFTFPGFTPDVWVSQLANFQGLRSEQIQHGAGFLSVVGRLRDGVSQQAAQAEMRVITHNYVASHSGFGDAAPGATVDLQELRESFVSGVRRALLVLMAVVGCVLIIACANVAGLTMARATGRTKEMALRAALGGGRATLLRQLLTESILLTAAGGLAGICLATLCLELAQNALAQFAPGFSDISLDGRVLTFTIAVSLLTAVAFGLWPAWRSSRPDLMGVLRDGGRGNTSGPGRQKLRSLMVVAQAAVSMVLLIGAALLLESFRQVAAIQPGFNPEHAVTMNVNLPLDKYPTDAAKVQFVHAVLDRQAALPGVQSLSAASTLPLVQFQVLSMFLAQGQPDIPVAQRPLAEMVSISPSYFQSLGVPLLAGRDFSGGDDAHSARVCIVSQNLARRYWPKENPVGKHVIFTRREVDYEVIGVAGDVKNTNLAGASRPTIYLDFAQFGSPIIWFTLRTAGDVNAIAKSAEAQIFAVDHSQPVTALQPLSQIGATSMAQRKQVAFLIGGFAVLALVLAMIGLYGVLSYSVAQRTTEIGVRQAIGANRGEIMRMVLAQGLGLSLAGVLVGAAGGIFITKPLTSLLYGVTPTEPWVFGAMALLFALIGALASSIPAWRATRIDPIEALR